MTADNLNNMRVIPDLLAINEKVRPNKVAYRQFDDKSKTWISVTWKEFADMVRSWRKAFTASGLSKGDHAAVLLPNSITATACDLSILSQGMVPVPLHAVDTPSSSAFILNNSEAKILFVPRTLRWNAMLNAQKEYPYLKLVVTTGNDAEGASEDSPVPVVNLSDWLKQGENTDLKEVSIDPDDLAAIVYTSGTTGKPKGVMLTHDNVLSNVKSFSQVIDVGSDDVFLSFLPFSHTFERTVTFYFTLFLGAEVGFARSVLKLAEDLKIIRPTIFVAVPRVFEQFHSRIKASLQSKGSIAATLADQAEMIGWRRFCRRNGLAVPSSSASWLDSFNDYPYFRHLQLCCKLIGNRNDVVNIIVCKQPVVPIDAFVKVLPHWQRLQPGAVLDQIKGAAVQMSRFSQIFIGVQFTGKIGQHLPEGECIGKPVFFVPALGD